MNSRILEVLEKQSVTFTLSLTSVFLIVIGFIDYITGHDISFSLFYLLPISLCTWRLGNMIGVAFAFICSIAWFLADYFSGYEYNHGLVIYWNTLIRFVIFLVIVKLLVTIKDSISREKLLARVDPLTGAYNSRYFYEILEREKNTIKRSSDCFCVVYIDVDNFKKVNDSLGHAVGDDVLKSVVSLLKNNLRITDVVARLGGDEFSLLLPKTNESQSVEVITKIIQKMNGFIAEKEWPISFSIGIVEVNQQIVDLDLIINAADELMYQVKKTGKNSILSKKLTN